MHHKNSLLFVWSRMNLLRLFCVHVGVGNVVHLCISFGIKALKSGIKGKTINDKKVKQLHYMLRLAEIALKKHNWMQAKDRVRALRVRKRHFVCSHIRFKYRLHNELNFAFIPCLFKFFHCIFTFCYWLGSFWSR